jgi:hypothetical protein
MWQFLCFVFSYRHISLKTKENISDRYSLQWKTTPGPPDTWGATVGSYLPAEWWQPICNWPWPPWCVKMLWTVRPHRTKQLSPSYPVARWPRTAGELPVTLLVFQTPPTFSIGGNEEFPTCDRQSLERKSRFLLRWDGKPSFTLPWTYIFSRIWKLWLLVAACSSFLVLSDKSLYCLIML